MNRWGINQNSRVYDICSDFVGLSRTIQGWIWFRRDFSQYFGYLVNSWEIFRVYSRFFPILQWETSRIRFGWYGSKLGEKSRKSFNSIEKLIINEYFARKNAMIKNETFVRHNYCMSSNNSSNHFRWSFCDVKILRNQFYIIFTIVSDNCSIVHSLPMINDALCYWLKWTQIHDSHDFKIIAYLQRVENDHAR